MPGRTKKSTSATDAEADTQMNDAPAEEPPTAEGAAEFEAEVPFPEELSSDFDVQRIRILPGSTDTAASFEIEGEDHTLGNALRYIIMKNPQVEFCGYTIPHPSEPKMNVRIQTYDDEDYTALQALDKGFSDLIELCDVVAEKFVDAQNEYKSQHA